MRITVLGLGYVGLTACAVLSRDGHQVLGIDESPSKVARVSNREEVFSEPGLGLLIGKGMLERNLTFAVTSDVKIGQLGDLAIISVGTPPLPDGHLDLTYVRRACEWVKRRSLAGSLVIMKSTVPPGTGDQLVREYFQESGIHYVSNPEFLREGHAVEDWLQPSRIVVGGERPYCVYCLEKLYGAVKAEKVIATLTTAETIKVCSNAFLATKISFINEIAGFCALAGADMHGVAYGIGLDPRIGSSFLRPGLGYGGSCLPKDTQCIEAMSAAWGYDAPLLRAVREINGRQRSLPLKVLLRQFGSLCGVKVAILGLAFKPGVSDVRDSPALSLIRLLVDHGAEVRATDPLAIDNSRPLLPPGVFLTHSPIEALDGANAFVLATEWDVYASLPWANVIGRLLPPKMAIDGRNALDGDTLRALGCLYHGVGQLQVIGPSGD
ncbi:MAG: UDP-glucose dehydrogenase family protein [Bacillota bacterium]